MTTWSFSDYGQMLLGRMTDILLEESAGMICAKLSTPSAKELVINTTKANVKRCYFREHG
jgi:hypothetical protein